MGDTDDTVAQMMKMLCDENRRVKKNQNRIDELMNQTLPDRRKMVVTDIVSIETLKKAFPTLFSVDQVCAMRLIKAITFYFPQIETKSLQKPLRNKLALLYHCCGTRT